jgi:hypothetical protein
MRAAAIGVVVLSLAVAGFGLYLVLVGPELTFVPAVPVGTLPAEGTTKTVPAVQGLIPLTGGILVLAGLAARRLWLAWIGAGLTTLFAALFVFGVGGALLPVVAALLILLGIVTWWGRSPRASSSP